MGELFFTVALVLIVVSYFAAALILLWNEIGPWISTRPAKRTPPRSGKRAGPTGPRSCGSRRELHIERPHFHPNL